MRRNWFTLRSLLLALFVVYLCIWPGSTFLVALGRVPTWGVWIGGALLILLGGIMGLWLCVNYGRRGALAVVAILVCSWAVEHLGVTTGFPFGNYGYTNTLQPKILGTVPLAIPFAWLLVVPAAASVAEPFLAFKRLQQQPKALFAAKVVAAAWLALLLDMTIEPVAVHVNSYWVWLDSGMYYGVPATNFLAWWTTSFVLVLILLTMIEARSASPSSRYSRQLVLPLLPTVLYLLNLLMFVLINLAHNQLLAGAIGIVLLAALVVYQGRAAGRLLRRLRIGD